MQNANTYNISNLQIAAFWPNCESLALNLQHTNITFYALEIFVQYCKTKSSK